MRVNKTGIALALAFGVVLIGGSVALKHFVLDAPRQTTGETPTDAEKTLHLSLSTDAMEGSTLYQIAQNFASRVEDETNGAIVVDLYEYGMLGKNSDMIQLLDDGAPTGDLLFVSSQAMVDAGCEAVQQTMKAGEFKDHAAFVKWASSSKADKLLDEAEKTGLGCQGLFFLEDGFYQTFLAKDESVSGKTILGLGFPESETYYSKKSATYELGPYVDIPDRVADGTIIGAELPLDQYEEEKMYEYLPYIVNDNHIADPYEAVITLDAADKIGTKNVKILKTAGREAMKEYGDILMRTDEEAIARLKEAGAQETNLK